MDYLVDTDGLKGVVKYECPNNIEKLKLLFESGAANFDPAKLQAAPAENFGFIVKILEHGSKFVKEVNLKHESGIEIKSWDDLGKYASALNLQLAIVMKVFEGYSLGGN